jgi:hypothetical protein
MAGGSVMTVPLTGGQPTTFATGAGGGLAIDATNVYWTDGSVSGRIMKAPRGGGAFTTLASAQDTPVALTVDTTDVYWLNGSSFAAVMSVPIDGGTPTTLASGLAVPTAIAVDDTSVYWVDNGYGRIMKLTPK